MPWIIMLLAENLLVHFSFLPFVSGNMNSANLLWSLSSSQMSNDQKVIRRFHCIRKMSRSWCIFLGEGETSSLLQIAYTLPHIFFFCRILLITRGKRCVNRSWSVPSVLSSYWFPFLTVSWARSSMCVEAYCWPWDWVCRSQNVWWCASHWRNQDTLHVDWVSASVCNHQQISSQTSGR